MVGLEAAVALISKYGLVVVAPIAVLEGPIVTVIAAWLASQHILDLWSVMVLVVMADLVGDLGYYALGRWGLHRISQRWRDRLGLRRERLLRLSEHFRDYSTRTLLFGKFTQALGGPILVAAGLAHMRVWPFLWINLAATIPKSLVFVALGYWLGSAYEQIDDWFGRISLVLLGAILLGGIVYLTLKWARK